MAHFKDSPIIARLRALRGRIRFVLLGNGLLMFLLFAAVLAVLSFGLDWLFHLPFGARATLLALMLGTMVWGSYRFFFGPFQVPLEDEDLALLVQSRRPEFGDDLITALQFSRKLDDPEETESKALIAATLSRTVERYRNETFGGVVSLRSLGKPSLQVVLALALVLGFAAWRPTDARLWWQRMVLLSDVEWPPETRIDVWIANADQFRQETNAEGQTEIWAPEGAVIRVEARAEGKIPPSVRLVKYALPRKSSSDPIVIELGAKEDSDRFEYRFGRVTESFAFHVTGGDDLDEKPYFIVHVRSAPRVDELLVDYDFPDYINETGRPDQKGVREYNVVGPRGTQVKMTFRTSADVENFEIVLDEGENQTVLELEADAENARTFVYEFVLNENHFYTYRLLGANGAPSREAPNFNMAAQPDLQPEIAIRMPDVTSIDVSPLGLVPLQFQVTDDNRVGEVRYRWDFQRDGDFGHVMVLPEELAATVEDGRTRNAFVALAMPLFKHDDEAATSVVPGDRIFVALEATDTRRTELEPEPNVTTYPTLLTLNVREPVEIERDLMRSQVRIKSLVQQVDEGVAAAIDDTKLLLGSEEENPVEPESIHALISKHAIMASGLRETERAFLRIFDGYLYNAIDDSSLTRTLIAKTVELHRQSLDSHLEVVAAVVPQVRRQIDETEAMGKLTRIMDILLSANRQTGPDLDLALKNCLDSSSVQERRQKLLAAHEAQLALQSQIRLLLDKMEAWEDFQDVIQGLKDIIELEKGLWDRTKKIAK